MKLTELLDQIGRLDKETTKGPWTTDSTQDEFGIIWGAVEQIGGGFGERAMVTEVVEEHADAEFIALARTFTPAAAKALRAVMELHKPETRWSYEPSPEWGFSTKVELFEFFDLDNEPHDPADVTAWQLCNHCAEVEQGAAEDLGHLTAIYPCDTVRAITNALGG